MKIDRLKLKTILFKKEIKQWQFAQQLGIHETNLSKIIVGRLNPSSRLVKKICKILRIKEDELIQVTDLKR